MGHQGQAAPAAEQPEQGVDDSNAGIAIRNFEGRFGLRKTRPGRIHSNTRSGVSATKTSRLNPATTSTMRKGNLTTANPLTPNMPTISAATRTPCERLSTREPVRDKNRRAT